MKNLNLVGCRAVERFFLTPRRPESEKINGRWFWLEIVCTVMKADGN